jgi:hypothetical protein
MKKGTFVAALAFVIGLALTTLDANAQMGSGMMGGGMMGQGMGSGMGNRSYGNQYSPQNGPQYQQPQRQLGERDARAVLENYLNSRRNPNLKLGKIEDEGNAFEGEILTRNNSLVDKLLVDKNTGEIRSVY